MSVPEKEFFFIMPDEISCYHSDVAKREPLDVAPKNRQFMELRIERTKNEKTKLTVLGQYGELCLLAHWHRSP